MVSIRDLILSADKHAEPLDVKRWGVTVYVHRLSLADKLEARDRADKLSEAETIAWCVARSVRDADGARIFSDDDLGLIADMDGAAIGEVFEKVREVSKLFQSTDEAAAEKKD